MNNEFDAIVVGSGISGGWAAKELTEKGLKVLLLERGRDIVHAKDYVNEHKEFGNFPIGINELAKCSRIILSFNATIH